MLDDTDLKSPIYYTNREFSWLSFNKRVLEESLDMHNPLLERLKFLAIFSSNLDEFFMVRVAGLKDHVIAGDNKQENKSGLTPAEQLEKISQITHHLVELQYGLYLEQLQPLMIKEKIKFIPLEKLTYSQIMNIKKYFQEEIYPLLSFTIIDEYPTFPIVLNKALNLAVSLRDKKNNKNKLAIVQVPLVLNRCISLPDSDLDSFIFLEDIIIYFLNSLFKEYHILSILKFRITRNANIRLAKGGIDDLLIEMETELNKRKQGMPVRLEVETLGDAGMIDRLKGVFEVSENDVYYINGPLDLTFFYEFCQTLSCKKGNLMYQPFIPAISKNTGDIFTQAIQEDILIHHPYESFDPVIYLIHKAALDPDVLEIKQTLYRVGEDSLVIQALKKAAENGKHVTVLVELRARFDEEKNVQWAKELIEAGCHVIHGKTNLKIHGKITLISRIRAGRIEHFVHLGTGNYNETTAKLYTDFSFITTRESFGEDAIHFFNYLSGCTPMPALQQITVAPFDLRQKLLMLIDEEIKFHQKYQNGYIIIKINALTDKTIIMKLYEASRVGVKIELIVRGICCLRPKIKNVSENITVRSIVSRFLEHSRIYFFHHNKQELYFLSSADLMTRNMEKRVEIFFPIFNRQLKQRLKTILSILLSDNVKAREQNENGEYNYLKINDQTEQIEAQIELYKMIDYGAEEE